MRSGFERVALRRLFILLIGFCLGAVTDWWLTARHDAGSPVPGGDRQEADSTPGDGDRTPTGGRDSAPAAERGLGTSGEMAGLPSVREMPSVLSELREKSLRVPLQGADVASWKGSFEEERPGHQHEAVDILAPRGTPVHAVDDGVVAKLFTSEGGGVSVYQYDPSRRFTYYYAHLDRYAEGIRDGDPVTRGQVIGYVGTTGNAPPDTPHLHFAIIALAPGEGWWQGRAVDPYLAYGGGL